MIKNVRGEPGFCNTNDVIGIVGTHGSKLIKFWEQTSSVEGENFVREGVLGETDTGMELVAELVEDVSKTAESAAEPPEQVVLNKGV